MALGNAALLRQDKLAIFCSARCPGSLIVQASDLAHALADRGAAVIGGFHTPMERACLEICWEAMGRSSSVRHAGCTRPYPLSSASL